MPAPKIIHELVARFHEQLEDYKRGKYNETQVRKDFIDPFFEALGWDMGNKENYASLYRDVIYEDNVKIDGATKNPDYAFCIGGSRKFFVEAKKPSVNIKTDDSPALQIRRYGWNAKLPLGIVTDFEEFAVYDTRIRPIAGDKVATARLLYFTFDEYIDKWDEIADLFSKEAILKGKFDSFVTKKRGKGTVEVDTAFLKDIENWREILAKNIVLCNDNINSRNLNYVVQITIDRILFLRICEDRGIEQEKTLKKLVKHENIYTSLLNYFHQADNKYNSGLFHFKEEKNQTAPPDTITPMLIIKNEVLKTIINGLYYPISQYEFSVMPADILGNVYEQFLGKNISLTESGKRVRIEEKPEVRKAGGVYYTPSYIVDYIVENTIGALVKDKAPKDIKHLTVLDPACGSGSFLIVGYQYLLDYYLDYYTKDPKKHSKQLIKTQQGIYRLTISERKYILLAHIYGVDIDAQAVEVTKLSLLLKVLEGENEASITQTLSLFKERALPNLSDNIKCGNSLIGSDFYQQGNLMLNDDDKYRINVFDWDDTQYGFGKIMQQGGFDAVIGNPPYVFTREGGFTQSEKEYYNSKFEHQNYQLNTYPLFVEQFYNNLKNQGMFGFIIPNNWLTISSMKIFRDFVVSHTGQLKIINNFYKVFKGANVDTSILLFAKQAPKDVELIVSTEPDKQIKLLKQNYKSILKQPIIRFERKNNVQNAFLNKIEKMSLELGTISKVSTGLKAYQIGKGQPPQKKNAKEKRIYHSKTMDNDSFKRYLQGADVGRYLIKWSGEYLSYGNWLAEPRKSVPFNDKRILVRQIPSKLPYMINSAYVEEEYYYDINNMVIFNSVSFDLKFIQGILTSKVISFWFYKTFNKLQRGIFPQFKVKELASFPIPQLDMSNKVDKAKHDKMVALVEKMMDLQQQKHTLTNSSPREQEMIERDINRTDKEIDSLTYKLYDLTAEEIKVIEGE